MMALAKIVVSLIPVLIFLAALVFLDSYKLVRFGSILIAIAAGGISALLSLLANQWLVQTLTLDAITFNRYVAPAVEEILKAVYMVYLIKAKKVGFMVDAAIFGFAVGAGFALAENIYYLYAVSSANIILWIVRGFGTAALHGATMMLFGIISKAISDSRGRTNMLMFHPGLFVAFIVHSLFNHFIISPEWTTVLLLAILPVIIVFVYTRSEKATEEWLGKGMDADIELLDLITTDQIHDSPVGAYLQTLKDKFAGPIVADMLCLLRIHCELALGAKGLMLLRQAGIRPEEDPDIKAQFEELKYLEKSLGKTGRLAIMPFLRTNSRDLWQLYMIRK